MYVPTIAIAAFMLVSIAVGLCVYEALSKRFAPPAARVVPARKPEQGSSSQVAVPKPLHAFALRISSLMPATRAQAAEAGGRLARAGVKMAAETWRGLVALCALAGALAGAVASSLFASGSFAALCVALAAGAVLGWALPQWWLHSRERARRRRINEQLPDAMEFLAIAVKAGSPVEQCFRVVAANIDPPLSEEFARVDTMVHIGGKTREEALRAMSERCRSMEVTGFASTVIQALSQGSSVADNLTEQARIARAEKHADVMERIKQMGTKLSVVLSLCYLPPVVALVLLPVIASLLDFVNDMMM